MPMIPAITSNHRIKDYNNQSLNKKGGEIYIMDDLNDESRKVAEDI